MPTRGRSAFFACAAAILGPMPQFSHAADDGMLRVYMDHARVLKLDRPVSKVIVGNSQVADATVADPKTIVLTGRSFGTTNIVLLDSDGNAIVDERVLVSIDEGNTVRVYRQTNRSALSCTPNCEQHAYMNNATPCRIRQPVKGRFSFPSLYSIILYKILSFLNKSKLPQYEERRETDYQQSGSSLLS